MKWTLLFIFFTIASSKAQVLVPFEDFNNYFRTFENGTFKMLEMQRILSYKVGDEFVAYIDNRGNLRIYDGKERRDLSNLQVNYQISDHLLAWNVGETLNIWDQGELQTLSYFCTDYIVKDSMIVYVDNRYNTLNAYYNKQKIPFQAAAVSVQLPGNVGDNILGFVDNGNLYSIFFRGNKYEIGVWNGSMNIVSGTNVAAFNDPITRTFAAFDKGQFVDLQDRWVDRYEAGRDIIGFTDPNGNLMVYNNGKLKQLSNFPSEWHVKDDLIFFRQNNICYVYYRDKTYEIGNYIPEDFQMKNGVFAYRNIMGGVSAFIEGENFEITNLQNAEYEIIGSSVLVRTFNNGIIVFKNGEKYVP